MPWFMLQYKAWFERRNLGQRALAHGILSVTQFWQFDSIGIHLAPNELVAQLKRSG